HLRPGEPLGRRRPACRWPEQLFEPLPRGRVVAPLGGVDHHLDREREGLDLMCAWVGRRNREDHGGDRGEREVGCAGDLELGLRDRHLYGRVPGLDAHGVAPEGGRRRGGWLVFALREAKNSGTASRSAGPPEIPSQRTLINPTSA